MSGELRTLAESAAACASDPLLIQGAGGNVSLKDGNVLWIKASGKWLENAAKENVFVGLDWEGVQGWLETGEERVPSQYVRHNDSLRPSIETSLHVVLPHRVVVHTHPVDVVALAVRSDGRLALDACLGDLPWTWVPYARPGRDLTEAVRHAIDGRNVSILVLQNHGLVVGAATPADAVDLTKQIVQRCTQPARALDPGSGAELVRNLPTSVGFRAPAHPVTHALARDAIAFEYFRREPNVLYPDQAVFLGDRIPALGAGSSPPRDAPTASYRLIPNAGVLVAADADPMVEQLLRFHAEVLLRLPSGESLKYLTPAEVAFLLDWEPEKYRQSLKHGRS